MIKKFSILTLTSLIFSTSFIGCIDGGGGDGDTPATTSTTVTEYKGSVSPGDFATISLIETTTSTNTLTELSATMLAVYYKISGPVFGTREGSFPIEIYQQKPFYKGTVDGTDIYLMLSGNLAFSNVVIDGKKTYVVALNNTGSITEDQVINKKFVYTLTKSDGTIENYTIELGSNNKWTLYNLQGTQEDGGTWELIDGSYIKATNTNGNAYYVIIKPGTSRTGFIVDLNENGFGIGLEQKTLTDKDITGTYSYQVHSVETDEDCFGTVEVYFDNNDNAFKYKATLNWCENSPNPNYEEVGTLTLNNPTDGMAKLTDPQNNEGYVFIDPEDGYFIAIKYNSSGQATEYIIGSNKIE